MRVCPKCGYIDPPEWRHLRWSYWIDFCSLEEFKVMHPNLAEHLESGEKLVEEGHYVYRLAKKCKVHRKAIIDYGLQFEIPMEHVGNKNKVKELIHNKFDFRPCWSRIKGKQKKLDSCVKR